MGVYHDTSSEEFEFGEMEIFKEVISIFLTGKVGDGFEEADHTSIWSNAHGSACGVTDLQLGRTYLVTGKVVTMSNILDIALL